MTGTVDGVARGAVEDDVTGTVDGVARRAVEDIVTESAMGVVIRVVSGTEDDGLAVIVVITGVISPADTSSKTLSSEYFGCL